MRTLAITIALALAATPAFAKGEIESHPSVAPSPPPSVAADEYILDDGVAEATAFGSSVPATIVYLNAFQVQASREIITAVRMATGSIPAG